MTVQSNTARGENSRRGENPRRPVVENASLRVAARLAVW